MRTACRTGRGSEVGCTRATLRAARATAGYAWVMTTEEHLLLPACRAYINAAQAPRTRRLLAGSGAYLGKPPLGYAKVADGRRVRVSPDKDARLVSHAFALAADPGRPLDCVLGCLRELGLTGKSGGPLGRSSLYAMLTNPFYAGLVRWEGELYEGSHEPLVDMQTFRRVQENLMQRSRNRRHMG